MALQGTLDTFALADLVRLVATTTKTGELAIEADGGSGSGRLWFVDGDLVAGEPADAGGVEDALFSLLGLEDGTFSFAPDAAPDAAVDTTAQDAIEVLARAEARWEAWRPIQALVPHPDVAVHLRDELPGDEVILDQDTWRQLVAVAHGTTARTFAAALDLDEVAAATAVKALFDQGLVEVDADGPAVATAPEDDASPVDHPPSETDLALDDAPALDAADALDDDHAAAWDEGPGPEHADEAGPDGWDLDPAPAVTAPWGAGPEAWVDDAPEPVVGNPFAPLPPEPGGSLAVDMDHTLGGAAVDHSYLGGEASALPEALPEPALATEPAAGDVDHHVAVADEAPSEDATPAEGDLALQLEALSPAAARAVAAAAASDEEADGAEGDAGRRVLRRIISSGRG